MPVGLTYQEGSTLDSSPSRSEEHTSELQSQSNLVCRLLLEKKKKNMAASRDPIFKNDYGLNINDNTPLLMMAAPHYYSLTGDKGFLRAVSPSLLKSCDYILS